MKKSELKKKLEQAENDLKELVIRPHSSDAKCITARVKYAHAIDQQMRNSADVIRNTITMSLPDCMDVKTLPQ